MRFIFGDLTNCLGPPRKKRNKSANVAGPSRSTASERDGTEGPSSFWVHITGAERTDAVDQAGIIAIRVSKALQPARQLIRSVRRTLKEGSQWRLPQERFS